MTQERTGRRPVDACSTCTAATAQAAVVPDTSLYPKVPGERSRVREMTSHLAAALLAHEERPLRFLLLPVATVLSTCYVR